MKFSAHSSLRELSAISVCFSSKNDIKYESEASIYGKQYSEIYKTEYSHSQNHILCYHIQNVRNNIIKCYMQQNTDCVEIIKLVFKHVIGICYQQFDDFIVVLNTCPY